MLCGIVSAVNNKKKRADIRKSTSLIKRLFVRLGGYIVFVVIAVVVMAKIFIPGDVYNSLYSNLEVDENTKVAKTYCEMGFPFSFCNYLNISDQPDELE